jgi:hypothetical protein
MQRDLKNPVSTLHPQVLIPCGVGIEGTHVTSFRVIGVR